MKYLFVLFSLLVICSISYSRLAYSDESRLLTGQNIMVSGYYIDNNTDATVQIDLSQYGEDYNLYQAVIKGSSSSTVIAPMEQANISSGEGNNEYPWFGGHINIRVRVNGVDLNPPALRFKTDYGSYVSEYVAFGDDNTFTSNGYELQIEEHGDAWTGYYNYFDMDIEYAD